MFDYVTQVKDIRLRKIRRIIWTRENSTASVCLGFVRDFCVEFNTEGMPSNSFRFNQQLAIATAIVYEDSGLLPRENFQNTIRLFRIFYIQKTIAFLRVLWTIHDAQHGLVGHWIAEERTALCAFNIGKFTASI